jgi:hypothetical protein
LIGDFELAIDLAENGEPFLPDSSAGVIAVGAYTGKVA